MSSASDHAGSKNTRAQTLFQHGNEAALKANYDYAIQMYQEACKLDPGCLVYRQALRGIERKKFNNEPSKVGRLVGARCQPIRFRARSAKSKGQYAHALEICEEAFVHNPWDSAAAREAAESAEQLGHKELAQWLMESCAMVATDADYFRHMAHVEALNSAWPKAIAAWERVKKIDPNDENANRQINALSASATIMRSGLNETVNRRATETAGPTATSTEELAELRQPQLSPEERWKKELEEDPTMIGPYLQYADHLKLRGQLDDAEKLLSRGLKAVPEDPTLLTAHAEIQVARLHRAIGSWERKAKERPDDDSARAKVDQLRAMLVDYELKEYKRRAANQPGDMNLQYELGLRLAKAGRHSEAISAFQQARSSSALRVQALLQAGLSFEADGALKLALRSYQDALKASEPEEVDSRNAINYRLGRVHEALGNNQAAEEAYNEVAANDYGYLDVAQRLRNLN